MSHQEDFEEPEDSGIMSDAEMAAHDQKFVEEHLDKLICRFDAVQIFVTRQEPDGRTMGYATGKGNFYSRWGVVNEWISRGGTEEVPGSSIEDP
jgi:hypothetical protein